jgi:hypothetical protein
MLRFTRALHTTIRRPITANHIKQIRTYSIKDPEPFIDHRNIRYQEIEQEYKSVRSYYNFIAFSTLALAYTGFQIYKARKNFQADVCRVDEDIGPIGNERALRELFLHEPRLSSLLFESLDILKEHTDHIAYITDTDAKNMRFSLREQDGHFTQLGFVGLGWAFTSKDDFNILPYPHFSLRFNLRYYINVHSEKSTVPAVVFVEGYTNDDRMKILHVFVSPNDKRLVDTIEKQGSEELVIYQAPHLPFFVLFWNYFQNEIARVVAPMFVRNIQ